MRWRLLLLLAFLVSFAAYGQGVQYGSIEGTVTDASGQPLPGVTVTASGPNLQGTRTAVAGPEGHFRLTPLPAGDYTVGFALDQFRPRQVSGVVVRLGTTTDVSVAMEVGGIAETISVTADQVVVDTTKSTVDTAVTFELADKLPTGRDFTELMEMAPNVEPGFYAPLAGGQSNSANLFLVDGVDTTDPKVQIWGTVINWDAIAATQLQTAGFSAEFGRAPGAVLNLVTKSGGNEFHGSGRLVVSREDWSADPGTDNETGRTKSGGSQNEETRPSVTLGGPVMKDRLWFFGSWEDRSQETGFSRYASIEDILAGRLTQDRTTLEGHYASLKLTWQASEAHQIVGFYNEDPTEQVPAQAFINGAIFRADTERDQRMGGENVSLQWTGVLSPSFFMEAKYQDHSNEVSVTPASATWDEVPYTYDLAWGYAYGGPSIDYSSVRNREGLLVSATRFIGSAVGAHELKGGLEYLDINPRVKNVWNDAGRHWTWQGAPYVKFVYLDQSGFATTQQDYWAAYVQDQWRLGNLTLNLGVRAEATAIHNNQDETIVDFGFGDQLAPRLGFAYDLNGDSIHGSISRYYYLATNYIGDYFNETTDHMQRWNWNYTCAPGGAAYYQHPDTCWTLQYDVPLKAGGTTIDPGLDPAYLDELSLGYQRLLRSDFAVSADFVWRWQDTQIDWYDPTASGLNVITNVPKKEDVGDKKWSEYQALSLSLEKRLGADRLQFLASYTYALKNDAWGVTWRDIGQFTFSNPELVDPLRYGRTHGPHRVKMFGSYTMPWRTVVGMNASWYSGNVYTATKPGVYGAVFIEERGSSEVGANWEADLYLEQPFAVGPVGMAVYANVFNAFDNQQVTGRAANSALATFRDPTSWQSPRRFELGFKIDF